MTRSVLVTGGGSGIGAACVREMAARGWQVIAAGLEQLEPLPEGVRFQMLDVCDPHSCAQLIEAMPESLGGIVHGAGIIAGAAEWQDADFARVMEINLASVFRIGRDLMPNLVAGGGAVVTLASLWSIFGAPNSPAYAASKSGLLGLTRSMALAWGPQGVRVNAVAPGWIETRLTKPALNDPQRGPRALSRIALGRWGQPEDVASVVGFLLSDAARYITGVMLPIDGGYSIG